MSLYKILNVKTKSITEAKRSFSTIIKEANITGEPIYILNHNKPTAVILDSDVYETLVKERQALEEELFYHQVHSRIEKGTEKLISSTDVINSDMTTNPFAAMPNEELFD